MFSAALVACSGLSASSDGGQTTASQSPKAMAGAASAPTGQDRGSVAPSGHDCTDLRGVWIHEHQSRLDIESVDGEGLLRGRFTSKVESGGQSFPVIGWVNPPAERSENTVYPVAFNVRWVGFGSLTTWNGYCDPKTGKIEAMWYFTRGDSEHYWDHTHAGKNIFSRAGVGPSP